jgi:hypothetical protein
VVARRIAVDERDGRAGQNVVELIGQERLPEAFEFAVRIAGAAEAVGAGREELDVMEEELVLAIVALGQRLRRIGAAVELEV